MKLKNQFSEQDLNRIKSAVKNAEENISGEIVPVIVERSGTYHIANYKSALFMAAITFVIMIILDRYVINDPSHALYYDPVFIFVVVTCGGLIGSMLPSFIDPVKRLMLSQQQLDFATRLRAETVFLEEEVFNTKQRTGILIFISFFEHEVIVMADKGINKVVDQKQWDEIVSGLVKSIRAGKIVDGLEGAIKECGDLLLEKGFVKSADDTNELGDDLRVN